MSVTELRRLAADVGELLERHERARDLSEFGRYADDPAGFIRDVLRADPWEAQVRIAEAVRDSRSWWCGARTGSGRTGRPRGWRCGGPTPGRATSW